ncbi:MAG: hypothetical protein ACOC42_01365 [Halobacteriota archaeon]
MDRRAIALATAAGVAAFILVGVTVTEVTMRWIEFSLFVGIPVGLVAGVAITMAVYLGLSRDAPAVRRRIALGLGTFGGAFLLVLALAIALDRTIITSLLLATTVGAIAGVIVFARSG